MVSLKELISDGEVYPWLYDGSTKNWATFEKSADDKHVVLFVSNVDITEDIFRKMKAIYEGTVMTDAVTIWLPIVKWTQGREENFLRWRDRMPWYTVWYFSQLAGLKYIMEEWNFVGTPLVVVMNPQGCVLSKHGLDQLPKFLDFVDGEKAVACRTKELLQRPSGKITDVLKRLFRKDTLRLLDGGSNNKKFSLQRKRTNFFYIAFPTFAPPKIAAHLWLRYYIFLEVKISSLKGKYVLLFISCLDMNYYAIDQIKAVYAGIAKDRVKMVLIPVGSERTEELPEKLMELQSDITCYTVQGHLPDPGINFIRVHWYFERSPVVVMMNPQGEVLSKYKFNLEPIVPLALQQPSPKEIYVYSLHWGGYYSYWNERFSRMAKAVAADEVLKAANIRIDIQNGRQMNNNQNRRTNWAMLRKHQDSTHTTICEGSKILNALEAFDKWKVNLTLAPFESCFKDYFKELS